MNLESDRVRPEALAFRELTQVVRHLEGELAGFRRRALQAEGRVKELESYAGAASEGRDGPALARENAELRKRLDEATRRIAALLERVRFVRQQHHRGAEK
jgi:hypothetical protein